MLDRSKKEVNCAICGVSFITHNPNPRYCSRACYVQGLRKPRKAMECAVCGKFVERLESYAKWRRNVFCSLDCANKARYRHGYIAKHLEVTDAAYLAGLLDGEGSIMLISQNRAKWPLSGIRPRVTITNTNQAVLEWVKDIAGVGQVIQKKLYNTKARLCWQWQAHSEAAESMLKQIRPYMKVKKAQADLAIEFQERLRNPSLLADRSWQFEWKERMTALNTV